jgi:segregation and condensation protein B
VVTRRHGRRSRLSSGTMSDIAETDESATVDGTQASLIPQEQDAQGKARAEPGAASGGEGGQGVEPQAVVEAVLFSTDAPLTAAKLAQILDIGTPGDVKGHIEALNRRYEESASAFRVQQIAGGYQMFTLPAYAPWIAKLRKARSESRLSQAALETLAIVAYKQPIIRADIEAIRGVAVGDLLVRLREMKLIKIVGRAEEVGRPLLYGTTKRFLEVFGLSSIKDLPKLDEEESGAVPKLKLVEKPAQEEPGQPSFEDEAPPPAD